MFCMDTVLGLILLVFEMLKIPKTKVEAQDVFGKCPRTTENLSKYTALQLLQYIVTCTYFLITSYILHSYPSKRIISVNEMHCPYKQSLS